MALSAATTAAIAVFRELGWEGAALDEVMSLPLGTPEQRRIAKAGLEKGEWGHFGQIGPQNYGWIRWIDVEPQLLAAFAVRQGVSAKRAANLLAWNTPVEVRVALLVERGKAFVSAYVEDRRAEWSTSIIAVAKTDAPPPAKREYWELWLAAAGGPGDAIPDEVIELRFADHLRAGLRSGAPAPRHWGVAAEHAASKLVMRGVDSGRIGAEEACELVLFAMDQAQRPSDRSIWASVLIDALQPDDAWLRDHTSVLLSAMSFSDNAVIERFAPVLLRTGDDDLIGQAILIGLTAKSAKAKSVVLDAAAAVPAPGADTVSLVAETIAPLLDAKNRTLAKKARALRDAWSVELEVPPTDDAPIEIRGLWQPTPALAPVPRFDPGPVTPDHLTALASQLLIDRHDNALSLDVERFLATANALARHDVDAVRTALRGVRYSSRRGLGPVGAWIVDEVYWGLDQPDPTREPTTSSPGVARDASVFQRLGEVPVLLSMPSWDDYRIDPADLAERLATYAAADAQILEADLLMALPRLDLELLTDDLTAALSASAVPIVLQDGSVVAAPVGQILRDWINEPLLHPGFSSEQSTEPTPLAPVTALALLPSRLTNNVHSTPIAIFPTWPDACILSGDARPALVRHRPNGTAPSTQLLDHLHEYDAVSLDDTIAAWQAGVLLPGVAQAPMLGWDGRIPSIAARAERWSELAHEGLLSVIWPLTHDALCFASRGARVAPGVDALVELLDAFLPEVQAALAAGLAPASALDLPGVRALAERTGSSRAVTAARALTALLPPLDQATDDQPEALSDEEFSAAWPTTADPTVVHDGASLEVQMQRGAKGLYPHATVILADGSRHAVNASQLYPLRYEGQMPSGNSLWLQYQSDSGVLVAGEERDLPASAEEALIVTHTLTTLALLSQQLPKDAPSYDLQGLARDGLLGPSGVAAAIEELLPVDGFDPYRVVRWLAGAPDVLPAFYPVLTRSIRYAAALPGKPPAWLVRIIDVATELAPVLREASARELLLADDASWPGLDAVASSSDSPTARRKATALLTALAISAPTKDA